MSEKSRELTGQMVHYICTAVAEDGGTLRIKIEINIAETQAVLGRHARPYEVRSRWWSGAGEVPTFALDELMATKLRALYQRRKGRDLFDLWHVLNTLQVDDQQIVRIMTRYMRADTFSFPQLRANLREKLEHPDFRADLNTLIVDRPEDYQLTTAADLLMERLGPL